MLRKVPMVIGYARMWPRAVFYNKALNLESGRERNLAKELQFLQRPGVYVLYRDDTPYYVGRRKRSGGGYISGQLSLAARIFTIGISSQLLR